MQLIYRILIIGAVSAAAAGTAAAQRGAPPGRGGSGSPGAKQRVQTPARDTAKKTAPSAVMLDFEDQDLKVVLNAIAAAGNLNVSLANIPAERATVHLGQAVPRDSMVVILRAIAEAHSLKFTPSPTLIQIAGPPPQPVQRGPTAQELLAQYAQANQQQAIRLFTYRLRHASAVQLAPVLTNLFQGATQGFNVGRGGTTVIPNGNGGFTTITTPGGNIQTVPPAIQGGAGRGGRGANAGGGGGFGNPATNNQNALVTAFAQAAGALSGQSNDIRIIAEESTNSLLIRATDSDWQLIQQIVQGVDLRPLQVLIEVTIAEVQRTHDLDIGVSGTVRRNTGSNVAFDSSFAPSQASARDFILQLTGGKGTIRYDVAIAALQERGNVRVLSLPVIIAQNNRQATLNVGSSRPFVQVSQTVPNDPTGRVQTVQYIDVGTVLTITPTINPDGYVNLQVMQQDNSATNQIQFDAPVINKREATTQVFIRDGQTTVIGGLADNTRATDVSGIPILSRIPLIGPFLFGNYTRNDETSELFLFLTPHIISSDEDIDKLREAVHQGSELLKDVNVGPHIVPAADTMRIKPDSAKPDSLTLLRRRPPATPNAPDAKPEVWR
ncbi:MAG TPA: secretin N-terminal domain-containing protein [Gemmatimonadaceae bacterium]|jgi:general secretion pathway protein D|nr:secretin N-terminal domain-containing protein [Gemmatimonadaceae bacterium]